MNCIDLIRLKATKVAEKLLFIALPAPVRHCRRLGKATAGALWATIGALIVVLGAVAMSVGALVFALLRLIGSGRSTAAAMRIDVRDSGPCIGKALHDRSEESFIKAERLWQLGRKHGFVYPRPIEVVDGILWSEYLANLRPVRFDYFRFMYAGDRSAGVRALFCQLGAALGAIHCNLQVPEGRAWQSPASFEEAAAKILGANYRAILAETPQRPLHCDFGFPNIHLIESGNGRRLVILDAEANGYQTLNTLTVGSIYLDLANFAMCVSGIVPLRNQVFVLARSRRQALLRAFLAGYRQSTGYEIDHKLLARLTLATTISYLSRSGPRGFGPLGQHLARLMLARERLLPLAAAPGATEQGRRSRSVIRSCAGPSSMETCASGGTDLEVNRNWTPKNADR